MKVKFKNLSDVSYRHLKNITDNSGLRPVLSGAYIDVKNQKIVATDAHVLVCYPIEVTENDSEIEGKIVPISYFNQLRYMAEIPIKSKRYVNPEYVLTDEYAEVYYLGELAYRCKYIEGKYPTYNNIIPDTKEAKEIDSIGLNINILARFTKAIPANTMSIFKTYFFDKTKAVVLVSEQDDYPIKGLVMPAHLR